MKKILNLAPYNACHVLESNGVFELNPEDRAKYMEILEFKEVPTMTHLHLRALKICKICRKYSCQGVMLNHIESFFLPVLEAKLKKKGYETLYCMFKEGETEFDLDFIGFVNTNP